MEGGRVLLGFRVGESNRSYLSQSAFQKRSVEKGALPAQQTKGEPRKECIRAKREKETQRQRNNEREK